MPEAATVLLKLFHEGNAFAFFIVWLLYGIKKSVRSFMAPQKRNNFTETKFRSRKSGTFLYRCSQQPPRRTNRQDRVDCTVKKLGNGTSCIDVGSNTISCAFYLFFSIIKKQEPEWKWNYWKGHSTKLRALHVMHAMHLFWHFKENISS